MAKLLQKAFIEGPGDPELEQLIGNRSVVYSRPEI